MNVDDLIRENFGLVVTIANSFKPNELSDKLDYIQAGSIGLFKAIKNYSGEIKFSTYASILIRREILREVYKNKSVWAISYSFEFLDKLCEISYNKRCIKECLPNLDKEESCILDMRLAGFSLKEIGESYGNSKQWAKSRIQDIIRKISKANVA